MAREPRRRERVVERPADDVAGMTAAQQQLIDSCQGMVRSLAWKVHQKMPAHVELDDLIAYGQLGLAKAALAFDPGRGNNFTTYAYHRIRGAILDGLSQMAWFSRRAYHAGRYEQLSHELLALDAEDRPDAGTLRGESRWLGQMSGALAIVYLASGDEDQPSGPTAGGLADTDAPTPDEEVAGQEIKQRLHELISALPADAGDLVRMVYFEGRSLREAADELGISKAWASRLHAKTLGRLARALRLLGAGA